MCLSYPQLRIYHFAQWYTVGAMNTCKVRKIKMNKLSKKHRKRVYISIPKTKVPRSPGTGKLFHHYLQRLNTLTATTLGFLPTFPHLPFTDIAPRGKNKANFTTCILRMCPLTPRLSSSNTPHHKDFPVLCQLLNYRKWAIPVHHRIPTVLNVQEGNYPHRVPKRKRVNPVKLGWRPAIY